MSSNEKDTIRTFENKRIRSVWDDEKRTWYLSAVDVCGILSGSVQPRKYWNDLKTKLKAKDSELSEKIGQLKREGIELYEKIGQLKMRSADGKSYLTDVLDTEGIVLLTRLIPSPKTGPFRKWLIETFGAKADDPEAATALVVRTENALVHEGPIERDNEPDFKEIISMIKHSREKVIRYANRELIEMYWKIGEFVSKRINDGDWGKAVVKELAARIQDEWSGIKGFSPQNLWRMKQFYETYCNNKLLSTLSREITWSNNVLIMMAAKTDEAREFYMDLTNRYNYSARDLVRQIKSGLFERQTISDEMNRPLIERNPGAGALRDNYILEFLRLPDKHSEKDLRRAIAANMHAFLLEFGKDFTFVDEEFRLRVGDRDFRIDLLFYNLVLSCYVAVELKTTDFRPEHLGQMKFYLDALDRDVKRPADNPSVGLVLCAGKDDTVVEYAVNRNMTPAMISEYQMHLPDKTLLENRLRELRKAAERELQEEGEGG